MKAITFALALVLVVAGCSSATDPVDAQAPTAVQPMPAGAKVATSLPKPSEDTSCGDPRASFQPVGALPAPNALPANSTMAKIRDRGRLIVGVDQNTYGFAFRDSQNGEIQGFALEIARQIAQAIFGDADRNPDRLQLTVLTSAQRIPAVENGDVDLVVHSMTTNCERWQKVDFSAVFYQARQRVLVRENVAAQYAGPESLAGKRVCATEGSTSLARIVNFDVNPKPVGVQVAGWTDCLVMMQRYQVDAISTDDTILAGLQFQDPFVKMVGDGLADEPYAIAMPKNDEEFVRFVNAVLEKIKADGTWTALYNQWLRPLLKVDATPPAARYRG